MALVPMLVQLVDLNSDAKTLDERRIIAYRHTLVFAEHGDLRIESRHVVDPHLVKTCETFPVRTLSAIPVVEHRRVPSIVIR